MAGLFRAIAIDSLEVQIAALEALAEVPALAYGQISEYIQKIGELTIQSLNSGAHAQTKAIMNFWINLATQE